MTGIPQAEVRDAWDQRIATNDVPAAIARLDELRRVRDAGSREAIGKLIEVLGSEPGTVYEAGCWYQVLVSWPWGFPPAPTLTPIDRYPFDPRTGPE